MNKKLNIKKLGVVAVIVIVLLVGSIMFISNLVKEANYRKTNEYKLLQIGYTENEVKVIEELDQEKIDSILNMKYDVNLTKFLKQKYFIYENLTRYLNYYNDNSNVDISKVVAIVNVGADSDWYSNIKKTDTTKENLMLVNKFYGMSETDEVTDLTLIPGYYALAGMYASEKLYDALVDMLDAARDAGYTLVVSQGYRSYADQDEIYNDIADSDGQRYADSVAARAGHSEYQTGLSVLIEPYGKVVEDVKTSSEHDWLINNAYKYGFILRYEEGKEDITGFKADPWRFRYVGVDVSSKIKNENITFDEYYAYYIEKNTSGVKENNE